MNPVFSSQKANQSLVDTLLIHISTDVHKQLMQQLSELGFPTWDTADPKVFHSELAFNPFSSSPYTYRTWKSRLRLAHQHNFPNKYSLWKYALWSQPKNPPSIEHEKVICPEADLSLRVFNSLKRSGITTIGDLLDMLASDPDAMLAIRKFGDETLDELVEKLRQKLT